MEGGFLLLKMIMAIWLKADRR